MKPKEPCYCGSGKKFKKCHRADTRREESARV
ncbi:MAG: SEC-C metal-binding domain-containing protein [Acidobacteriota bacterium]